jgi:dipeptidyl aminopeptidase/acylaminoacyl peptidase
MRILVGLAALAAGAAFGPMAQAADFSMSQAIAYPFVDGLVAAPHGGRIAWMRNVGGVRNIWVAEAPGYVPRQVTQFKADDGQELTQLTFSDDGASLIFVRGGDHDANWPAKGNLQPNPMSDPAEPKVTLWLADPTGAKPAAKIVEGDAPAISAKGALAYVKDGQVWTAKLDGSGAQRLFFDRGKDAELAWSPDGARLTFVSNRDDHAFIGVYSGADGPIAWLAPSTGRDGDPVWSPEGKRIAFTRRAGAGGAPETELDQHPTPWAIWTADAASGVGKLVWKSGKTLRDSYGGPTGQNLRWASGGRLTFISQADNWPHLYVVPEAGGAAKLLTPGAFMVEHVAASADGDTLAYSANTGGAAGDDDRRHVFRVSVNGTAPVAVTRGDGLEWTPAFADGALAYVAAGAKAPPVVAVSGRVLEGQAPPAAFAGAQFVVPKQVTWKSADGTLIHGQLFEAAGGPAKKPAVIFVHGGPPRQMLLGWSYMDYYSNGYAVNQYLANHGFAVLAVNYRRGIGYGYDFQHPDKGGAQGAVEYSDVLAGARFLQTLPEVDGGRIGIWGGSYGGLLTGLALARNSDVFKAGVDLHGVHDWSRVFAEVQGYPLARYERGDFDAATKVAFESSPDADVSHWTSPVLLIQGDDDRNVRFSQMVDLVRRLDAKGVDYEELVLPDEIHGFLRHASWEKADAATADFMDRKLKGGGSSKAAAK